MAFEKRDACVGCGKSPCFNCKETIAICDMCDEEVEKIYTVDYDGVEESWCVNCIARYIRNHPINFAKWLISEGFIEEDIAYD